MPYKRQAIQGSDLMVEKEKTGDRQRKIAKLWFKGYLGPDIAVKLGYTSKQVSEDLKVIKGQLQPKTFRAIEYYRNQSRRRLDMLRKEAWEIAETLEAKSGAKIAALRLVKDIEDLSVKVDGVVTDKMPAGPDRKAEELGKRLVAIAQGNNGGNGHKEIEVKEIAHSDS